MIIKNRSSRNTQAPKTQAPFNRPVPETHSLNAKAPDTHTFRHLEKNQSLVESTKINQIVNQSNKRPIKSTVNQRIKESINQALNQ